MVGWHLMEDNIVSSYIQKMEGGSWVAMEQRDSTVQLLISGKYRKMLFNTIWSELIQDIIQLEVEEEIHKQL